MSKAKIYYHDIGDYLSREEKLTIVKKYGSADNIPWETLTPNEHGDWLNPRNDVFGSFISLGDKETKSASTFFAPYYSNGLKTQRDAWCYNSNKQLLEQKVKVLLNNYEEQRKLVQISKQYNKLIGVKEILDYNSEKYSWTRALEWDVDKGKIHDYSNGVITNSLYRPFFKQHLYFYRGLNEMVYLIPKLFPKPNFNNFVLCVSGLGGNKENSSLITDHIPDLNCLDAGTQCFPLYFYEERQKQSRSLFDTDEGDSEYIRRDGVSDFILERAKRQYGKNVEKEDIFYYVYGFLHGPEYREKFANDLKKMLPRLPLVEDVRDFWAFSKAGRKLADLHIHYEKVPPLGDVTVSGAEPLSFLDTEPADTKLYQVEKMRFPGKGQKDTIHYNSKITVSNIPGKAYGYVVNGKSAIEWIMERYQITTHKESGIRNDPNDWAKEVGNPRYILDLLLSIINVSVQTVGIVEALPKIKFE